MDLCSYLVHYMNWKPLRDGIINVDFLTQICDIFNFVPNWWQLSMLKWVKTMLQVNEFELYTYVCKSDVLDTVIEALERTQIKQAMMFSVWWSIFKVIENKRMRTVAAFICDTYSKRLKTPRLNKVICPLMRMLDRCTVSEPIKPHTCAVVEIESENDTSQQIFPFQISDSESPVKELIRRRRERYSNE